MEIKEIILKIENELNTSLEFKHAPKPGMDNEVLFATSADEEEYVIKIGDDAYNDVLQLNLLIKTRLRFLYPRFF